MVATDLVGTRWSTHAEWFDWLIVAVAAALGAVTVWIGSAFVRGPWDGIFVSVAWAFVGAGWALAVALGTTDRVAQLAAIGLVLGSLATLFVFGPIAALVFVGPTGAVLGLGTACGLVVLVFARQRPARLIWLLAPAITLAAIGLHLTGIPQSLRFAAAEPALNAFVIDTRGGAAALPSEDEPVTIGGVPIYDVIVEDGQVRLVTGYVGILGDDPAGIAYVDEGSPAGVGRSDHLAGHWYHWYPY